MLTDEERNQLRELPEVKEPLRIFELLRLDIEKLRVQLRAHEKATPTSKMLRQVGRRSSANIDPNRHKILEISGARLAANCSVQNAKRLSDSLAGDPTNSRARVELVDEFLRKGTDETLLSHRDAFILIMLEVEAKQVNTEKLQVAMRAQKAYFGKLEEFLDEEFQIQSHSEESGAAANLAQLTRNVRFIKEMSKTLPYQTFSSKEGVEMNPDSLMKMGRGEIEKVLSPILDGMSALPLAKTNRDLLLEVLEKTAKISPLAGYHKSRIFRRNAQIKLIAAMSGDKDMARPAMEDLSNALKSISQALPMMKKATRKDLGSCIKEYALICLMVYQYVPRLGGTINADHVKRMEHASKLLNRIIEERGILGLQRRLDSGINYMRTEKKAPVDRGRKTKAEREEEKDQPTLFRGGVPKDKMINSDEEVDLSKESTIFRGELPEDGELG